MKLWSIGLDETLLYNFPQIIYKNKIITVEEETFLTNKIFDMFLLTHRDAKEDILNIRNKEKLPYKKLHNLILSDPEFEFETEYFVEILNFFHVEI